MAPSDAQSYDDLGRRLAGTGKWDEAIQAWRQCIAIDPQNAAAYCNLSVGLGVCRKTDEAIAAARQAIALDPTMATAYNNLGGLLNEKGKYSESIPVLLQAVIHSDRFADAYLNLGNALQKSGRLSEALEAYRKATALSSNHSTMVFNESLAELLAGNFRIGWEKYEQRWNSAHINSRRNFIQPLWLGSPSLSGKRILLHAEQGFGDTFQFVRYAQEVCADDAVVYLEVQPALKCLLFDQWPSVHVLGRGETLPPYDFHCPLLSLPLAFRTELCSIPTKVPYITAPTGRTERWKRRLHEILDGGRELAVGIVWSGNPESTIDRDRSVPLSMLLPLLATPGCRFIVLQKIIRPEDRSLLQTLPQIVDASSAWKDFDAEPFTDTATLISQLDLIISVETAVAHLAGAMGAPTWIPLPFAPNWRWLLGRDDSPWYPTVRLFRQRQLGAWPEVIQRMADALREKAMPHLRTLD